VTNSSSVQPWTLRMPAGSQQQWNFTFTTTAPGGATPYPISGKTWEYVVRTTATDTGAPLIDITTLVSGYGQIAVTATAALSQILLTVTPAATASLTPGTYWHALWMNPGPAQFTWLTGNLIIQGNAQP